MNEDLSSQESFFPMKNSTFYEKKLPEVIGLPEFNQILKQTKKPKHRLAFKLAGLAGLRISEVHHHKIYIGYRL
jgi:integrase